MSRIAAFGLAADAPGGWEGEIYRREDEGPIARALSGVPEPVAPPIVHLANFALPAERGDYGGGAVDTMGSGGVFISLLEHDSAEAGSALFSRQGVPWPLSADDFQPAEMQRPLPGQAGCQRFFLASGRPFCLYVAIGSYRSRALLVREVNAALATVEID